MYQALFVIHVILRNVFDDATSVFGLQLNLYDQEKEKNISEVTSAWNSSTLICLSFELVGS